jgi:hypothetical protein
MRPTDTLTKRGKHFQESIEGSRSRYSQLPDLVRVPMMAALHRAAMGLDARYQKQSVREALANSPEAKHARDRDMMIAHYLGLLPK